MIDFKQCDKRALYHILSQPIMHTESRIQRETPASNVEVLKLKAIFRALKKSGRYDEKDLKRIEEKIKKLESL